MASEATAVPPPALSEARTWIGCAVDDVDGKRVGRAQALFVDQLSDEPTWLVARLGRFSGPTVAIPMGDCAGGGGRIWVAHHHRAIRAAPVVDPQRVLLREHELTICAHYGIGERIARAAQVASGPPGSVTSRPA